MKNDYVIDTAKNEIQFSLAGWEPERGTVNLSGIAYYFIEEMEVFREKDSVTVFENGKPSEPFYSRSEQGRYYQIGVSFARDRLKGDYILFRFIPESREIHIFG
jgi:hypothetical protein